MSRADQGQRRCGGEAEGRQAPPLATLAALQGEGALRILLASLAEGVVIIDTSGTILLANRRAEMIFGYPPGGLAGLPHAALIPERFATRHDAEMAAYYAEPKVRSMGQLLDLVGRRRDGSEVPVEVSLSYIATVDGLLVISFVSDITSRKEARDEIERLNTALATRAEALEAANRDLEAFSYTVAHDLRKPLTIANGYCQIVQEECAAALTPQCRDYLQEAFVATERMNQMIDTLLDFSRSTRIEVRSQEVDLTLLAREVAAELQLAEPQRRVTLRIAEDLRAVGDRDLLRVALDNLIGNAWKYTGARPEATIEVGAQLRDEETEFFVRDNGSGFDMTEAQGIFAPFQRLAGAEKFRGFGIGLATVARIIRRHGGTIRAEGEKGKGATFYFTLPARR